MPWGNPFLLPLPPRLAVGLHLCPEPLNKSGRTYSLFSSTLVLQVRGALSPHGRGPWECRGLASGAQMPLAGGGRWLQKRGGNGAPCRGSSFPQEIAQMPYVSVSSLQSLPGMTAGGRGGCLGRSVAPIYEERGAQGLAAGRGCWLAWGAEPGHRSSWGWRGQGGTRPRCCGWAWGS